MILRHIAVSLFVLLAAGLGLAWAGVFDVSAREPHWRATAWFLDLVRSHSIRAHAKDVTVPASWDDHDHVVQGMAHYQAHCRVCHGGPGLVPDGIARGMYPNPPDLTETAKRYTPAELFWITKNGIKMTGMPAWASHSDSDLWGIVALLNQFPALTPEAYAQLAVEADTVSGGHHHHHHDGEAADHSHAVDETGEKTAKP